MPSMHPFLTYICFNVVCVFPPSGIHVTTIRSDMVTIPWDWSGHFIQIECDYKKGHEIELKPNETSVHMTGKGVVQGNNTLCLSVDMNMSQVHIVGLGTYSVIQWHKNKYKKYLAVIKQQKVMTGPIRAWHQHRHVPSLRHVQFHKLW